MANFEPFDLSRVIGAAEQIKGARRQAGEDAIRNQYLQTQIAGAQQQQDIQKQAADAEAQAREAKKAYYISTAALNDPDPKSAVESLAPEFVQHFEQQHGQGTWKNLTPQQAIQAAREIQTHAMSIIGPQTKVKWVDSGGSLIPVDETTGQPIQGTGPIDKSVSPDSALSAQTSMRGQDIGARTAAAGQAITARGQDIGAQTAAAGRDVTVRGQDLTAETARTTAGGKITETQGNAKAFGLRATAANTELEKLIAPANKGGGGYPATAAGAAFDQLTVGHLGANWLASPNGQKYQNLAKAFIAPILRKESGAAISDSEWSSARQLYIPSPGDSDEVLAQKAVNRRNAIQGLSVQAGPGGIPENENPPAAPAARAGTGLQVGQAATVGGFTITRSK